MRLGNIIIALVFFSFAYLQFNDPDPIVWVSMYGAVALLATSRILGYYSSRITFVIMILLAVYAAFLIPDLMGWIKSDNHSEIFGEMNYERPHIEGTREFLGLMIAEIALAFQFAWKTNSQQ